MSRSNRFATSKRWPFVMAFVVIVGSLSGGTARADFPTLPKVESPEAIKEIEDEFLILPPQPGAKLVNLSGSAFSADVMKDYRYGSITRIAFRVNEQSPRFREAVFNALYKISENWTRETPRLRKEIRGPIDDTLKRNLKKEHEYWAVMIIELELKLDYLKVVVDLREKETKRWQANYDFAVAATCARLAYLNEYNKVLGQIITEELPPLDARLKHDGYVLVASDKMLGGKEVKKLAEEAQEMFQDITVKYKGTPWAMIAKKEKTVMQGLAWKPASLKKP